MGKEQARANAAVEKALSSFSVKELEEIQSINELEGSEDEQENEAEQDEAEAGAADHQNEPEENEPIKMEEEEREAILHPTPVSRSRRSPLREMLAGLRTGVIPAGAFPNCRAHG